MSSAVLRVAFCTVLLAKHGPFMSVFFCSLKQTAASVFVLSNTAVNGESAVWRVCEHGDSVVQGDCAGENPSPRCHGVRR